MKIAFIIPTLGISGGIGVVMRHANSLAELGHEVHLINLSDETFSEWTKLERVLIYSFSDETTLRTEITDVYDIAFATFWPTMHLLRTGLVKAKQTAYLIQGDEENFYDPQAAELRREVRDTYAGSERKFVVSHYLHKILSDRYPDEDFAVVQNGVEFDVFDRADAFMPRGNKLRVLVEGATQSRLKRVIESLSLLRAVGGLELWLVSPTENTLEACWPDLSLSRIPHDKMPSIYKSCDVLFKWSETEGFSLPVLEMMAAGGVPVVNDFGGQSDIIEDGISGFVLDRLDASSVAQALQTIASDYNRYSAQARERAKQMDWSGRSKSLLCAAGGKRESVTLEEGSAVDTPHARAILGRFSREPATSTLRGWMGRNGGGDVFSGRVRVGSRFFPLRFEQTRDDVAALLGAPGVYGFVADVPSPFCGKPVVFEYTLVEGGPTGTIIAYPDDDVPTRNEDAVVFIDDAATREYAFILHRDKPSADTVTGRFRSIRGWIGLKEGGDVTAASLIVNGVAWPMIIDIERPDVANFLGAEGTYGFRVDQAPSDIPDVFEIEYNLAGGIIRRVEVNLLNEVPSTDEHVRAYIDAASDDLEGVEIVELSLAPSTSITKIVLTLNKGAFLDGDFEASEAIISPGNGPVRLRWDAIRRCVEYRVTSSC